MIRQQWYLSIILAMMVSCGMTQPVSAISWDNTSGNGLWSEPTNWFGNVLPISSDDVSFGDRSSDPATMDLTAIGVQAITMTNGATLSTGGGELVANAAATLSGAGTRLTAIANPNPALDSFDAETLTINSGATLRVDNGVVEIDNGPLLNNVGGTIIGYGKIELIDSLTSVTTLLNNGGTLAAGRPFLSLVGSVWTLNIDVTDPDGRVDLDGTSGGNGVVSLVEGTRLVINATISDAFDGTMTFDAETELDISSPWSLNSGSVVTVNADSVFDPTLVPEVAEISGGAVRMFSGSIINIDHGMLDFNAALTVDSGAAIDLDVNTTLALSTASLHTITDPASIVNNASGTTIIVDNSTVDIGTGSGTFNWDGTGNSTMIVRAGGVLNIDVDEVDTGNNLFNGTIRMNSGDIDVQVSDPSWTMDGMLRLNNAAADPPVLSGSKMVVTGDVVAGDTGKSRLSLPVTFTGSSSVVVEANADLDFGFANADLIVFQGGSYTGPGTITQNGNLTVEQNTDIDVATYDWDGDFFATTTVNPGVTFTINSASVEDDGNGHDRPINVNSATLNVNTIGPWVINLGTLNLTNTGAGIPSLNGSPLIVRDMGAINMTTQSEINADLDHDGALNLLTGRADLNGSILFRGNTNLTLSPGTELRFFGATEYRGGTYVGDGELEQNGAALVSANTTIDVEQFDFDGLADNSTTTIAPGVVFRLNVDLINSYGVNTDYRGTARVGNNATLIVNTPTEWGIETSGLLRLQGAPVPFPGARVAGANFALFGSGRVEGNGVFSTNVRNGGFVAPGLSAGTILVSQNYLQTLDGTLEMELGGTIPITQHDQLNVQGNASLAGVLDLTTIGGYVDPAVPGTVDAFLLVLAGSISGDFDAVMYNAVTLLPEFGVGTDGDFVDHVGAGLFRIMDYSVSDVRFLNYKALPGDANGDGVVDGSDFGIWNANKFTFGTDWTTGDFNGDGRTDGTDFGIWNSNVFTSVPLQRITGNSQAFASVPEPAAGWVLLAGCLLALKRRVR